MTVFTLEGSLINCSFSGFSTVVQDVLRPDELLSPQVYLGYGRRGLSKAGYPLYLDCFGQYLDSLTICYAPIAIGMPFNWAIPVLVKSTWSFCNQGLVIH